MNGISASSLMLKQHEVSVDTGQYQIVILVKIEGNPFNITLIQVYTSTTDSTDEDINKFYRDLDSAKNTCKSQDCHCDGGPEFQSRQRKGRLLLDPMA